MSRRQIKYLMKRDDRQSKYYEEDFIEKLHERIKKRKQRNSERIKCMKKLILKRSLKSSLKWHFEAIKFFVENAELIDKDLVIFGSEMNFGSASIDLLGKNNKNQIIMVEIKISGKSNNLAMEGAYKQINKYEKIVSSYFKFFTGNCPKIKRYIVISDSRQNITRIFYVKK